ncbi:phage tail tape measure protein [Chthonobacter albigriseus]|uniref:phage tail tape measure protein n=1 Tax=Chthonobacter albigriseus TaxID=1683161 RepID=UPI0015EE62FE|nr:phage tail tape measure protein [Chthonobacter albigriseus]
MRDLERVAGGFGSALTRGLKAAVVDGKALDQVLRQLALRMSGQALDAALAPLGNLVSDAVGGLARQVIPFAKGGVVAAPTYFPMDGGRMGLAGEAGAEAILPLARGADGRLGVRTDGGGVNVTFNVTAGDAASFRRSEAQVTAMLARAVGRGRRGL